MDGRVAGLGRAQERPRGLRVSRRLSLIRMRALVEAIVASAVVTGVVTAASKFMPELPAS